MERSGQQIREELVTGECLLLGRTQVTEHSGAGEEMFNRIDAQQRREQRSHRRQIGDLTGDPGGHTLLLQSR